MLIFDIGANVGRFAIANYDSADRIVCIEASKHTFDMLLDNVKMFPKIVCENYAVINSKDDFVTFYDCVTFDTISSLNKEWLESDTCRFGGWEKIVKEILVKPITIDALITKYGMPDLVKIDVEGAEDIVLESLTQKVPLLCFEWAAEMRKVTEKCINHLTKIGYTKFEIQFDDNYTERPKSFFFTADETIQYINSTEDKNHWGMIWAA